MSLSREELIYMAKISEQTERFEDMLDNMKQVVKTQQELSVEERNLLSVAYKNSVGSRRTAWRAISSIEQKEESKGSKYIQLLKDYKKKIETELNSFCNDILELLDQHLISKGHVKKCEKKQKFKNQTGGIYLENYLFPTNDLTEKQAKYEINYTYLRNIHTL